MFSILMVCTANICRSPVAQQSLATLMTDSQVRVSSAGTRALSGNAADPRMRELALERGWGDMSGFRSRPLLPSIVQGSDLILCMERSHVDHILHSAPTLQGRVKLFGHWQQREIDDPTNMATSHYLSCLQSIEEAANSWKHKLHQSVLTS
jgi:protein-tyrosine phosphatase